VIKWLSGLPTKICGFDYDKLQLAISIAIIPPLLDLVLEFGLLFSGIKRPADVATLQLCGSLNDPCPIWS